MSEVDLTISSGQKEPSSLRLVATMAVAGAISGLALAGVYEFTKPTIERNRQEALDKAVLEVVPGSARFEAIERVLDDATGETGTVYVAYAEDGTLVGCAIEGSGAGFQDTIRLLFGYEPDTQRVIGLKVLDSRETPGLGDKIFKDTEWVAQFSDLDGSVPLTVTKDGANEPGEIDAITSATISAKAVADIINEAIERWRAHLDVSDETGGES